MWLTSIIQFFFITKVLTTVVAVDEVNRVEANVSLIETTSSFLI